MLEYLSDLRDEVIPLFSLDVPDKARIEKMIRRIQGYFNLSILELNRTDSMDYCNYALELAGKNGMYICSAARKQFDQFIEGLHPEQAEDGYEILHRAVKEMAFSYYMHPSHQKRNVTGQFIEKFSEMSRKRFQIPENEPEKRRIGFSLEDDVRKGEKNEDRVSKQI